MTTPSQDTAGEPVAVEVDDDAREVGGAEPNGSETDDANSSKLGTIKTVLKSAGVRVLVLPVSAVLGVICTRLIFQNFGSETYAQYGLLVAIGAMLPFADLGMSAAIMNAVGASGDPAKDPHVRKVLITSVRVLIVSALVLLVIDGLISLTGAWPAIMGEGLLPRSGPIAAAGVLALIAITLPVAFGQRVLTGLGKNHVTIAILGLQTPFVLVALLLIIHFDWEIGEYLPIVPYIVAFGISIIAMLLAAHLIRPVVWQALRDVPKFRSVRGGKVFDVAWPTLIQMIALPLAMQTDRLVLSHVSDSYNLSRYNLGSQMYIPVWQVVTAAGMALWPVYARARATGESKKNSPIPLAFGFGAAAAAVCLGISAVAPWLADVASDGEIELSRGLMVAFSIFMIIQAIKFPLGMFMTDAPGLRYQAFMVIAMVPVNLGLSILLAQRLGAIGPVIGSAIGVFIFQLLANWWYVRRALRGGT